MPVPSKLRNKKRETKAHLSLLSEKGKQQLRKVNFLHHEFQSAHERNNVPHPHGHWSDFAMFIATRNSCKVLECKACSEIYSNIEGCLDGLESEGEISPTAVPSRISMD